MNKKRIAFVVCVCLLVSIFAPVQYVSAAAPSPMSLTLAQRNSASLVLITAGNVSASISASQPETIYKIIVDTPIAGVVLYLSNISATADLDIALYNSSGIQLTNKNSTGTLSSVRTSANKSRTFKKICYDGVYYVRVFSRNHIYDSSLSLSLSKITSLSGNGSYMSSIPSIAQRKDQWCWAACSEMIGKWTVKNESANIFSTSKTQEDCAAYLGKGNQPAYNYESIAAINYMTSGTPASNRGAVEVGTMMLSQFNEQLYECSRAVAIQISSAYSGHLMVVRGVATGRDGLFLLDPWATPITSAVRSAVAREVNRNDIIINGDYASGGRKYVASIKRTDW